MRRRNAALVAAALLALLAPAGAAGAADAPRAQPRVVGGTSAAPGQFPWMVALSMGCGATLVAPDRVLTAAHCVQDERVSALRVYVGARVRERGSLRFDGRRASAADIAVHPGYRSVGSGAPINDVALIRLATPVTGVPLVPLATPGQDPRLTRGGSDAAVIGWGAISAPPARERLARTLRRGALRILSDRSCGSVFGTPAERGGSFYRSVMVCARSADADRRPATSPCSGDSGGPLMSDGVQVGIVSYGIVCGALREPTVFARVAGLRAFIDDRTPTFMPQPLGRPVVQGVAAVGRTLSCRAPAFRNPVSRIGTRWGISGRLVAYGPRFRVPRSARGRSVQCRVTASNRGGRVATARSAARRVPR